MRESIGGAWLTGIVATFLVLFAAFLTYAINYTKAFRVKDRIISIIEENEGYTFASTGLDLDNASDDDLLEDGSSEAEIFYFIKQVGYNYAAVGDCSDGTIEGTSEYGYCIEKHCVQGANTNRVYYKVTSYIALSIPIVNVSINVPITGETTSMYFDRTGMDSSNSDYHCYFETE